MAEEDQKQGDTSGKILSRTVTCGGAERAAVDPTHDWKLRCIAAAQDCIMTDTSPSGHGEQGKLKCPSLLATLGCRDVDPGIVSVPDPRIGMSGIPKPRLEK